MDFRCDKKNPFAKTETERGANMPRHTSAPQLPRGCRCGAPGSRRQAGLRPQGIQQGPELVQRPRRTTEPHVAHRKGHRFVQSRHQSGQGTRRKRGLHAEGDRKIRTTIPHRRGNPGCRPKNSPEDVR